MTRYIRRACETYGIFDRLYPDNSRSFTGNLVAGGAVHKFRNAPKAMDGVKPLGICHHLGIAIHFATPEHGQSKIAERCFASLSRVIEDRPEFKGAHAGHKPGASPDAGVTPIALEEARRVLAREVNRYNAETGRRGQGMRGRSYRDVFEAGLKLRVRRVATSRQLYLAGLIYTPVAVDRWGRVTVDDCTYGDPDTQDALLKYHDPKSKTRILLGRNPDDFDQPALAYNEAGELICEGILPVKIGAYGSVDGIRTATRNRKAVTIATRRLDEAQAFMDAARFKELTDSIPDPGPLVPAPAGVVEGHFGSTLKPARVMAVDLVHESRKPRPAVPEEYLRNLDAAIAQGQAYRR
ncbi:transposase domain-containing protein [Paracoccaceae bacterium Fryx2]|nr:transposase domain-containing protein [Paracoccaceae bacterium Fryx2]